MDEEKMQRHMEFLLEWQAQFAAELGELKERDQRNSENITRLEGAVTRLEGAVTQLEGVVERVVGVVERLADRVSGLVDSVSRLTQVTTERFEAVESRGDQTDRKLDALVDAQIQTEESLRNLGDTLNRHIKEGHRDKKDEPED
ncbi:MAG TPA: hypothetical protein VF521_19535 [Pyrinomonadaceae bacterium]|jgi:methyl-accepting chemotaxis protein